MAAGATYEPIATTTLGSAQSSVTFSSISQGYTDLVLICTGKMVSASTVKFQFNGDTGSNYSMTRLYGNGSSAASERYSNGTSGAFGVWRTTNPQYSLISLQNYSNTTTNKTYLTRDYDDSGIVSARVGLWRNTSAITSISIIGDGGGADYATGSTFTLYGILAA